MLIANPRFNASTVSATTTTTQVAPTIIKTLGLNPYALEAVREEGTAVLPELEAQLRPTPQRLLESEPSATVAG